MFMFIGLFNLLNFIYLIKGCHDVENVMTNVVNHLVGNIILKILHSK